MTNEYLHMIRDAELEAMIVYLPSPIASRHLLEIGAGTGRQANLLAHSGYCVVAIDVASSAYAGERVHPVADFDGKTIPLNDGVVDIVFSSNVLEHVRDLDSMLAETLRVLGPDGIAIHILPTSAWRFWTTVAHIPWLFKMTFRKIIRGRRVVPASAQEICEGDSSVLPDRSSPWLDLIPRRHGERGNLLTEHWYFSSAWWHRTFERAGFKVTLASPVWLSYSGCMIFGAALPLSARSTLARVLGPSTRIYVLRPDKSNSGVSGSAGSRLDSDGAAR